MNSISGFLSKTFEIFSDEENDHICGWGPAGDTIIVKRIDEFAKYILPKYFKHSNFQSFVRQLNMYDFHKTVQDPSNGEFQHTYFLKGRPELLCLIKRKAHSRSDKKANKNESQDVMNFDADNINPSDAEFQRFLRDDFERRLSELETQQSRILELEAQQMNIARENAALKHLIIDTRSKMEKVLKMLYQAFINSGYRGVQNGASGKDVKRIRSIEEIDTIPESKLHEFCNFLEIDQPSPNLLEADGSKSNDGAPMVAQNSLMAYNPSSSSTSAYDSIYGGKPLEQFFSFDTLAHAISVPNDSTNLMSVKDGTVSDITRLPSLDLASLATANANNLGASSSSSDKWLTTNTDVDGANAAGQGLRRLSTIGSIDLDLFAPDHHSGVTNMDTTTDNTTTTNSVGTALAKKRAAEELSNNESMIISTANSSTSKPPSAKKQRETPASTISTTTTTADDNQVPIRKLNSLESDFVEYYS